MTRDEATRLAQEQAAEFGVVMIVVRDDLCEDDPGGFQCCASTCIAITGRSLGEWSRSVTPERWELYA